MPTCWENLENMDKQPEGFKPKLIIDELIKGMTREMKEKQKLMEPMLKQTIFGH